MSDRLRTLGDQATPEVWSIDGSDRTHWGIRSTAGTQPVVAIMGDGYHSCRREDAAFIVAARNLWQPMLAVVEAAECGTFEQMVGRDEEPFRRCTDEWPDTPDSWCEVCTALVALGRAAENNT